MENGPVDIVDLPINSMVIFHSLLYVYQRVHGIYFHGDIVKSSDGTGVIIVGSHETW